MNLRRRLRGGPDEIDDEALFVDRGVGCCGTWRLACSSGAQALDLHGLWAFSGAALGFDGVLVACWVLAMRWIGYEGRSGL